MTTSTTMTTATTTMTMTMTMTMMPMTMTPNTRESRTKQQSTIMHQLAETAPRERAERKGREGGGAKRALNNNQQL